MKSIELINYALNTFAPLVRPEHQRPSVPSAKSQRSATLVKTMHKRAHDKRMRKNRKRMYNHTRAELFNPITKVIL